MKISAFFTVAWLTMRMFELNPLIEAHAVKQTATDHKNITCITKVLAEKHKNFTLKNYLLCSTWGYSTVVMKILTET